MIKGPTAKICIESRLWTLIINIITHQCEGILQPKIPRKGGCFNAKGRCLQAQGIWDVSWECVGNAFQQLVRFLMFYSPGITEKWLNRHHRRFHSSPGSVWIYLEQSRPRHWIAGWALLRPRVVSWALVIIISSAIISIAGLNSRLAPTIWWFIESVPGFTVSGDDGGEKHL